MSRPGGREAKDEPVKPGIPRLDSGLRRNDDRGRHGFIAIPTAPFSA